MSIPSLSATPLADALQQTRMTRALVEELISAPELLGPDFTAMRRIDDPAVAPSSGALLGWKATGRGKPGTSVGDTLTLLEEAKRLGLVERLDWAFRCHAFDIATMTDVDGELHLTPEPETFGSPCPPRLAVSFLRGRRALTVVAELHPDAFGDERRLLAAVEQMRAWGWQFSYADLSGTAAERIAIEVLDTIRPAYLQLDVHVAARSAELLEAALAAGATTIATGVDTGADLARAHALGATWARGALIGLPTVRPY